MAEHKPKEKKRKEREREKRQQLPEPNPYWKVTEKRQSGRDISKEIGIEHQVLLLEYKTITKTLGTFRELISMSISPRPECRTRFADPPTTLGEKENKKKVSGVP